MWYRKTILQNLWHFCLQLYCGTFAVNFNSCTQLYGVIKNGLVVKLG